MLLQQEQLEAFNTAGYVRLRGAVPKSDVEEMCDRVWSLIEELTGNAGDIFLCHPGLLHAPAMNVSSRSRLMRTQHVYTKAVRERLTARAGSG